MCRVDLLAFVKFKGGVRAEIPFIASELYLTVSGLVHGNYRWSVVLFLTF